MARKDERFGAAVRAAYQERGFKSDRHAQQQTGFNYATLNKMRRGYVPSAPIVVKFAAAIGESVNKWLRLAGYRMLPGATTAPPEAPDSPVQTPAPENGPEHVSAPRAPPAAIPTALHAAIAAAPTREEKIQIAWEYVWLRGDELGVEAVGATQGHSLAAKLQIIRQVERATGVRLLPPEVV